MTLVGGRYRLGPLLGRGGSADVHEALDVVLDRPVAVKMARDGGAAGTDPALRAAARLRHPNIVAILDAGTYDGRRYVVLELVEGLTLDAMLRSGPVSTFDALTVVGAVLDALAHAHRHGVLHLDLSPSNIMVGTVDGEPQPSTVLVLDLDGSRVPTPGDGSVTVSPEYAAPEIATATAADERSDVYSVGALLYLLLTGHPPFERSDPADVLRAQVSEIAPRPSDRAPAVPAAVDRIVARALAKDPAARFGSAEAMCAAVGRALSVLRPRTAAPAAVTAPAPSTTRRLPVVPPAAPPRAAVAPRRRMIPVVVAVLLGSAVVGGLALLRPSADEAQGGPVVVTPTTTAPTPAPTPTEASPPPSKQEPDDHVTLPDVAGLDVGAAQEALAGLGLLLDVAGEQDSPAARGTVLAVEPTVGHAVPPGATVHVIVASGFTVVPVVLGQAPEAVDGALVAAGLVRDATVLTDVDEEALAGSVLRAVPPSGSRVPVGTRRGSSWWLTSLRPRRRARHPRTVRPRRRRRRLPSSRRRDRRRAVPRSPVVSPYVADGGSTGVASRPATADPVHPAAAREENDQVSTEVREVTPQAEPARPRPLSTKATGSDSVFVKGTRAVAATVLVITGGIGVFLASQSIPTLRHYGFSFFTETQWAPETDTVGIAAVLVGTVTVALVAMSVAFPLSLATALYISEFAPPKVRSTLVSMVDLMAAVPSIIYGLWGFFLLQPHASAIARFLHANFGWIPIFAVDADPDAAQWEQTRYTASAFIAGLAVAMMVLPMASSVMREVFSSAPLGEREGALALGSTRWGVIRSVVLPFGRGGIIGGTMLGLGRALGETIAVLIIVSPAFDLKFRPLEIGTNTVSALIAGRFGEASTAQLSALLTAGFVLFCLTLVINTLAAVVVSRSRSGAGTDI